MKMKRVLAEKVERGHAPLFKVKELITVREAAVYMAKEKIGATLVESASKDGDFVGIFTERDIMNCCAQGLDINKTKVSEVMTRNMVFADAEDMVRPVVSLMTRSHIRHIPLKENGKVVALISIRDIMHVVDEEKDITINELSDYLGCTSRNQVY